MNRFEERGAQHAWRKGAVVAGVGLCLAPQVWAQETPAKPAGELAEVLVTGSRIARDGFDASTPVTTVNAADIKLSGSVNIEHVLTEAPQFVASTNGGATANTVPGGTADVNLRGFGAARNLV